MFGSNFTGAIQLSSQKGDNGYRSVLAFALVSEDSRGIFLDYTVVHPYTAQICLKGG